MVGGFHVLTSNGAYVKIRTLLLLVTVSVSVAPIAGLSIYSLVQINGELVDTADESLQLTADSVATRIEERIQAQEDYLRLINSRTALRDSLVAHNSDPNPGHVDRMERILGDAVDSLEGILDLHVVDLDGAQVASTSDITRDWNDHPAFIAGSATVSGDVLTREEDGRLLWYGGAPLVLDDETIGVLIMVHHTIELLDIILDRSNLGETGEVMALQQFGPGFIILNPLRFGFEQTTFLPGSGVEHAAASSLSNSQGTGYHGRHAIAIGHDVAGTDLMIIAMMDRQEALAARDELVGATGIVLALFGLGAVAAALYATANISRPIVEVSRRAEAIGRTYGMEPLPPSATETEALEKSVDAMAATLLHERELLEHRVEERTADLEDARIAAESAEQAKSRFLASMSHEIRTPLNAVIGLTDVLLTRDLSPDDLENLRSIRQSGNHLLQVINQVLDFSKIESGRLELHPGTASPRVIVESACEIADPIAAIHSTVLAHSVSASVPDWVMIDAPRLRQVLVNLIGNAIKATPGGQVDLEVRMDDAMVFDIRDDGIGIAPEDQARLFEAFEQAEAGGVPREGTGLGLAISQRIVQAMGGHIELTSEPGKGSTFSVHLPFETAEAPVHEDVPKATPSKKRILVADDSATNRRVARLLLEGLGHDVHTVNDGRDVLDSLNGSSFDILLIDLEMEHVGGLEVARHLQKHPARSTIELIAFTAHIGESIEEAATSAGFDRIITKPATREMLAQHVGDASGSKESDLPTELLADLRADVDDLLKSLRQALPHDLPAIAKALHGLKGVLWTVGWMELGNMVRDMETNVQAGNFPAIADVDDLESLIGDAFASN